MQLRTPGTTVVIVIMWKPGQLHLTSFAEWFLSYQTDGRIPLKIPDFALLNDTVVFFFENINQVFSEIQSPVAITEASECTHVFIQVKVSLCVKPV